jgi:hypothetical protein
MTNGSWTNLERMGKRDVGRLVEEQLMDCHTPDRARKLAAGLLVFSHELAPGYCDIRFLAINECHHRRRPNQIASD